MATSDQFQSLLAAFTFGLLFQAALAAVILYFKGHCSTIRKDSRRLVLISFLTLGALWAQVDFISFAIPPESSTACQFTVIVSALSDQVARIAIGGFLLWSVGHLTKSRAESYALGALMGIRVLVGAVFVGFVRPQFAPLCIAQSNMLPASVTVMILDYIILGILMVRVFTLGLLTALRDSSSAMRQDQSKALVYCTGGFFIWTLASATMLLGTPSIAFLLRTALPAAGLTVLVLMVTIFHDTLTVPRDEESSTPEARSPFVAPAVRPLSTFSENNGSPGVNSGYMKRAKLFVVNPSPIPGRSPSTIFRGSIKADDDIYTKHSSVTASTQNDEDIRFSAGAREATGSRSSSSIFGSAVNASLGAIGSRSLSIQATGGSLVPTVLPAIDEQPQLNQVQHGLGSGMQQKRSIFGRSKKPERNTVHTLGISNPIMVDNTFSLAQPLARVRTIDLETAVVSERERREVAASRQLVPMRPAPPPPKRSQPEVERKTINVRRNEMPKRVPVPIITIASGKSLSKASRLSVNASASATSTSLSPGREDVRRRSPRTTVKDPEEVSLPEPPIQDENGDLPIVSRPLQMKTDKENPLPVMYINDIVYDHSGTVKSIVKEVPTAADKSKPLPKLSTSPVSLTSHTSVLHRQRPCRRKSEKDRGFQNSQSPLGHRKTKSGSFVTSRNSQSPQPVHQLPTTAARLERLLPNDTRSMTVEEKISLLFPAPPGAERIVNRRSSVPSLPQIPSSMLASDPFREILTEHELLERRNSKRTTISLGMQSAREIITPLEETRNVSDINNYRLSAATYRALPEMPTEFWALGLLDNLSVQEDAHIISTDAIATTAKRQSVLSESSPGTDGSHDDAKSAWASIHSPIPAVDVTAVQRTARETYIQMRKQATVEKSVSRQASDAVSNVEQEKNASEEDEEVMTVMLGLDKAVSSPASSRRSLFIDGIPKIHDEGPLRSTAMNTWHKRIGDELPTFSHRKKNQRSRTISPPRPLVLSSKRRRATTIEHKPEVDTVVQTPRQALKEIQVQLSKFEWPNRESFGIKISYNPDDTSSLPAANDDRAGLLEDLEKEMGLQENHWMQMQHNFDRDSNSMILSPQTQEDGPQALPSPPSETSSHLTSRNGHSRFRTGGSEITHLKADDSGTIPTRNSSASRSNMWQQRLAEAQLEFVENAPALMGKLNINFLSVSRTQPGSPTPPDSLDSGIDSDSEVGKCIGTLDRDLRLPVVKSQHQALWECTELSQTVSNVHLWTLSPAPSSTSAVCLDPVAISMRPAPRRNQHLLTITSNKLWSKPTSQLSVTSNGLWMSMKIRPKSIVTRPKTQKPQRKSKRMTVLPDILESPSPLPHKRNTLGIFQFPWGEKSDSAVYYPVPVPNERTLPLVVAKPTLGGASRQIEAEAVEYSSSFFDDYDEEFEEDSLDNSDDDFDETTLWDIASLLNAGNVPSKNSLLPPPRIIEDYDDESDSDQEIIEGITGSSSQFGPSTRPPMVKFVPIRPLRPVAPTTELLLNDFREVIRPDSETDLSNWNADAWEVYLPFLDDAVRAQPFESAIEMSSTIIDTSSTESSSPKALWKARHVQLDVEEVDLFTTGNHHQNYCTSHQNPAVSETRARRKIHVDVASLPKLESKQLWNKCPSNAIFGANSLVLDGATVQTLPTTINPIQCHRPVYLWNGSSTASKKTCPCAPLWTAQSANVTRNPSFQVDQACNVSIQRTARVFERMALTKLSSTSFWTPKAPQSTSTTRHWLHATALCKPMESLMIKHQSSPITTPFGFLETESSGLFPARSQSRDALETKQSKRVSASVLPAASGQKSIWTAPIARSNTVPLRKQSGSGPPSLPLSLHPVRNGKGSAETGGRAISCEDLWRPRWGLPGNPREGLKGRSKAMTETVVIGLEGGI